MTAKSAGPALLLEGGAVWDGLADGLSDAPLAIVDGRIAPVPAGGAQTIDLAGYTALPGLIEAHAHLCFDASAAWRATYDGDSEGSMLLRMAGNARAMLDAGITTVRDLGAPTTLAVTLRDAIGGGLLDGPDLLVAGAPVTVTGGHCWFMGGEADGEDGVRLAVRRLAKAGVDWIKVMASGGHMTPGTNPLAAQYTVAEIAAIVEEAHRLGLRVAAHCHGVEGIRVAVEGGVDTLEHCSFQTPDGIAAGSALIAEIARRGTIVSPTVYGGLSGTEGTERWGRRAELLRSILEAGCPVVMSTDCGIPGTPHTALAASMETFRRLSGMPPVDVLRLATSTSATLLGLDDRGTLEAGKRADVLVVEGNPAQDLDALQRVRMVVKAGRVVFDARPPIDGP